MTGSADEQLREELIPACEGEPDDELATRETTVLLRQRAPPRFNVYIFVISLATLIPLSTLGSLVDVITARFSSKEYELVIGLLFLSAAPARPVSGSEHCTVLLFKNQLSEIMRKLAFLVIWPFPFKHVVLKECGN